MLLGAVILLGIGSHEAEAMCMFPGDGFAPVSGSSVASGSVVYVFVSAFAKDSRIVVTAEGKPVASTIKRLSKSTNYVAYSVVPKKPVKAYSVEVHRGKILMSSSDYQVTEDAPKTVSEEVKLLSLVHETLSWTCSSTDAYMATPSVDAVAYRVEWASTPENYRAGRRASMVVPRNNDTFWAHRGDSASAPRIAFGHLSCFGSLLPLTDTAIYVGIATLGFDGKYLMPKEPTRISKADLTGSIDHNKKLSAEGER